MVTIDEIMRHRYRKENKRPRFNIVGFSMSSPWRPTKACVICHVILISGVNVQTGEKMPGLTCPKCGMNFLENEPTAAQEGIKPKHGKQETRIITARTRKKYTDKMGNAVDDPDLIAEVQKGNTINSYNEIKSGEDIIIDSRNKRVIRSKNDLD